MATSNQSRYSAPYSAEATAAFATAITLMIVFTIVGNILVIIAVLTSRSLRGPQNLFLVSLAAADILVATLIIPFSLANELMGYWYFRSVWCEIYLALDVLFCTSSIVHLCAISLDRYMSVSRPLAYGAQRTPRRIKCTILVVWLISAIISFPPLLSMNKNQGNSSSSNGPQCQLNEKHWYILYSSIGSFFAPCLIMIFFYIRIYQIAKQRMRCPPGEPRKEIPTGAATPASLLLPPSPSEKMAPSTPTLFPVQAASHSTSTAPMQKQDDATADNKLKQSKKETRRKKKPGINTSESSSLDSDTEHGGVSVEIPASSGADLVTRIHTPSTLKKYREVIITPNSACHKATVIREKRCIIVLAVVIGVFVVCWFPFFFSYSLQAICPETCSLPKPLFTFFFWLGYCNSCLNPVIYTIFNKDFRQAFKRILCENTKRTYF